MSAAKIIGVMQNMWVKDPDRMKKSIERYGEKHRRRFIHYSLFAGCKSGRVLKSIFGQELCDKIIWEEASKEIGGKASSAFPADMEHLYQLICNEQPHIVIAFGKIASNALKKIVKSDMLIIAPHPAARHPTVMDDLSSAYRETMSKIYSHSVDNRYAAELPLDFPG